MLSPWTEFVIVAGAVAVAVLCVGLGYWLGKRG